MLANRKGWFIMKCLNKVLTIIGCITAAVAVVTAAFAVLNYFKEKKENAELEAYLEVLQAPPSIQAQRDT